MRASAMSGSNNIVDVARRRLLFPVSVQSGAASIETAPVGRKKPLSYVPLVQVAHPYRHSMHTWNRRKHAPRNAPEGGTPDMTKRLALFQRHQVASGSVRVVAAKIAQGTKVRGDEPPLGPRRVVHTLSEEES